MHYDLVMAWEEVAVLRANCASLAAKNAVVMRIILAGGVLLTLLVVLRADLSRVIPPTTADTFDRCLYALPIAISVLVAISGWFQWGTKAGSSGWCFHGVVTLCFVVFGLGLEVFS